MGSNRRRRRVEPTDEWEQLAYEEIRPLTLFGGSVPERANHTGTPERTLYRRLGRFEAEGMESIFAPGGARRKALPPAMRRHIVDLKAEYPGFNPNEIAVACYVRFGRRPDRKTVRRVLSEEPVPLRIVRRYPPYQEMSAGRERRLAVVALHAEGWSAKAIAGYLRVHKSTVHRVLRRWAEEGPEGLEDRRPGRPPGVRKVTLRAPRGRREPPRRVPGRTSPRAAKAGRVTFSTRRMVPVPCGCGALPRARDPRAAGRNSRRSRPWPTTTSSNREKR